jgi:hypothetical protein
VIEIALALVAVYFLRRWIALILLIALVLSILHC